MKYIAASLLVAGAAAQSFDAATAINNLITATNKITSDVGAYTGGSGDTLVSDAKALVSQITSDDASVKSAPDFTNDQALALAQPVQNLGTAAKSAVDALVAKKATFVSSGEGAAVYSALSAQASASNQFSTDLLAKVPSNLQPIASNLAAPISSALASGVSAFADVATASGSASGSATGSASSVAASTTAASTSATASASASASASSNGTVTSASPTTSSTTIPTGGANSVIVGSGIAGLALLAALAL